MLVHTLGSPRLFFYISNSLWWELHCPITFFLLGTWCILALVLCQLSQRCVALFDGCVLFHHTARPPSLTSTP